MHILVTGGCGYVGSVLVPRLLYRGHQVTVYDAMWFGNHLPDDPLLTVVEADIRQGIDVRGADLIIHLAAVANDPCCEMDARLSWDVNCVATERLANDAVRHGINRFIYASSGSVYGVSDAEQVTEETELVPISDYNKTKMIAERVLLSYANDINIQILRPGTVCGLSPRMRLDVVVNMLTMQALTRGRIRVLGGPQVRPNVHIEDMADLYVFMIEHPELTGVFNTGFQNLSVTDIAKLVALFVPAEIEVLPSDDPRSYRLSSARIVEAGFQPRHTVGEAVNELAAAYADGRLADRDEHYNVKWMRAMAIA